MTNCWINLALISAAIVFVSAASAGAQDVQAPPRQSPRMRVACRPGDAKPLPGPDGKRCKAMLESTPAATVGRMHRLFPGGSDTPCLGRNGRTARRRTAAR